MALTLPKLTPPKSDLPGPVGKQRLSAIVGGVVVLAAAGWFGWQYFGRDAAAPPPPAARKPQAVTPAKPAVKPMAKATAPADTAQARDKLIEAVLAAAGLTQQLDQMPQQLIAGIRQSGMQNTKASPAVFKAIEDAVAEAFTAEGFQSRVRTGLRQDFDQKRMQALLQDFSTPAAKAMIELERASPSPEELARFARSTAATRPAPARARLITRIDTATRASDLAVEVAFISMKAFALGIAGKGADKTAAIDKTIEKQRAATTRKIRDATLLSLAFSFKDASDADLEKYAAINEAQNSKWLYDRIYAAVLEEVKSASSRAGERIGELARTPAMAAPKRSGSKAGADARACLGQATNSAIIRCAEAYR